MTDLTICANCKHYTRAEKIEPAWCWANPNHETVPDYVTGGPAWVTPVECWKKNHGQCPDYEFKSPETWFTSIEDLPRKHWWQK